VEDLHRRRQDRWNKPGQEITTEIFFGGFGSLLRWVSLYVSVCVVAQACAV